MKKTTRANLYVQRLKEKELGKKLLIWLNTPSNKLAKPIGNGDNIPQSPWLNG